MGIWVVGRRNVFAQVRLKLRGWLCLMWLPAVNDDMNTVCDDWVYPILHW